MSRIVVGPRAAAAGPVSAKETGVSPTETSQSSDATRPRIATGTRTCISVAQIGLPAPLSRPNRKLKSTSCQTVWARA
jgi:hypothetical protein